MHRVRVYYICLAGLSDVPRMTATRRAIEKMSSVMDQHCNYRLAAMYRDLSLRNHLSLLGLISQNL